MNRMNQPIDRHTHHQYTVRPPVGRRVMSLAVDHLRRHVLDRPAERERLVLHEDRLLAQTKVRELDVTVRVQQNATTASVTRCSHLHTRPVDRLPPRHSIPPLGQEAALSPPSSQLRVWGNILSPSSGTRAKRQPQMHFMHTDY